MPCKAKSINLDELKKHFKLVDGELCRVTQTGEVKPLHGPNDKNKYHRLTYKRKLCKAHRVIYSLYHNIEIDDNLVIDHINGNKSDNRIENLRAVTHRENLRNRKNKCKSGIPNIDKCRNKWRVRIYIKKAISFGVYSNIKHASIVCTFVDKLIVKNYSAKQIKKEVAILNEYLFIRRPELFDNPPTSELLIHRKMGVEGQNLSN